MSVNSTKKRGKLVRFESLEEIPRPPKNTALITMPDEEAERRAAADPDAGLIPPGFWERAIIEPTRKEQITLRLDPEVLQHFRCTGKGYQSRINAVLKSYVRSQKKAG